MNGNIVVQSKKEKNMKENRGAKEFQLDREQLMKALSEKGYQLQAKNVSRGKQTCSGTCDENKNKRLCDRSYVLSHLAFGVLAGTEASDTVIYPCSIRGSKIALCVQIGDQYVCLSDRLLKRLHISEEEAWNAALRNNRGGSL